MWTPRITSIDKGQTIHYSVEAHPGKPLDYATVIHLWQKSSDFRTFFMGLLKDAPFDAYFWETPSVTQATVNQPFEFVLVDSPTLSQKSANTNAFSQHFKTASPDSSIVTFANLGRDATLVVPCPQGSVSAYTHLATFSRQATLEQQHSLWEQVGLAVEQQLSSQPMWVSTSGLGVFWLHIRLDNRPKYYTHTPYRKYS